MASTDSRPLPLKNTAYRRSFVILGADGRVVPGITWATSRISKDNAAFANTSNSVQAVGEGNYYIDLTASEMNADSITWKGTHTTDGAPDFWFTLHPKESADVSVTLESNQDVRNVTGTVASVTALAANSINDAAIAADAKGAFVPDGDFKRDNTAGQDEYTYQFVNTTTAAPLAAGSITGTPTITVQLRDAGTTPISAQAMVAVGDGFTYKYNTSAARIPAGDTGIVSFGVTHATLGALTMKRVFVGRDTAS